MNPFFAKRNVYKTLGSDGSFVYVIPAGNDMFKINNRNTRTRCKICSKLTIKTPQRRQWRRSGVFFVNFEHISHLVLVFLLLTLSRYMQAGICIQKFSVHNGNRSNVVLGYDLRAFTK